MRPLELLVNQSLLGLVLFPLLLKLPRLEFDILALERENSTNEIEH